MNADLLNQTVQALSNLGLGPILITDMDRMEAAIMEAERWLKRGNVAAAKLVFADCLKAMEVSKEGE